RVVAWVLMLVFCALPWLRANGKPLILLDLPRREFTLFGTTFLPTDGVLLMLLLLAIFVGIVLTTSLVGRAWCGWACPQTIYLEFLYRPLERLFEGKRERQIELDRSGGGIRRFAKNVTFLVVSVFLGNTFLAYFVGTDRLLVWVQRSPWEHPEAFAVMGAVSALVFADFAWFREQMCTLVCPYARLQSVLLDRRSLIVGYDARRGEPRSKGKPKPGSGDCIDCNACVVACPTGIDIRQGLQLECVACAQCVDACNSVMARIKKPPGLIRYGAQDGFESGAPTRVVRVRVVAYAAMLGLLVSLLVGTTLARPSAEVILLRGLGAPFETRGTLVTNQIRIKVRNRTAREARYRLALLDASDATLVAPENPLRVPAGEQRSTSVFVTAEAKTLAGGQRPLRFRISDDSDFETVVRHRMLGPSGETHQ
ncbi:MAG TPA: cytochrome c oxidase accessory protein CcoG, partial [Polyangiaceae bacterium]